MNFAKLVIAAATIVTAIGQTPEQPVRSVSDPGIVTTRQSITPAGVQSIFSGRAYGAAWGETGDELWVLNSTYLYKLDWKSNKVIDKLAVSGTPGNQSIISGAGVWIGRNVKGSAQLAAVNGGALQQLGPNLGKFQPGGLAVSSGVVAVPLVWENKLALIDAASGEKRGEVETGIAPFAAVMDRAATFAFVSNLGGIPAKTGELSASPMQKPAEKIKVDARGVGARGSITRIDLRSMKATHTINVGRHPTGLAFDEKHARLYVASGNDDSVDVIDTAANKLLKSIPIQPFNQKVNGIAPTAVAISNDGATLFVACGGINAIAVVAPVTGTIKGLIPTGWYPNALALSKDGNRLAVTTLLGPGSGWRESPNKRFVHSNRGSVAVVDLPDAAQLKNYTTAVAENNRLRLAGVAETVQTARSVPAKAIPERSGEPSLIEHVVFIVKENRTYDQVLGDVGRGNGDPSLVMFGAEVTPNQHKLAEQFVLLDNFFATGGNSADGHQWLTQANEVEYCLWPGYQGRSYPFDGTDPMAYSSGGFLWDYALARGRTVKIYGEYAGRITNPGIPRYELLKRWSNGESFLNQWTTTAPIEPVNKILAKNFPAYTTGIPDVIRAQIFIDDLKKYEAESKFPNLTLIQLPSNHTNGTLPGQSTPQAMVADNDYALGQIVDALSHSKFWPKMAIFVVEDDAQNGVDHVDGHRTTAFLASPYARRGHIDSTFYAHQSMLKTMELILGLPTMSLFDLIAQDMRNSFSDKPDLTPFNHEKPHIDLFARNPQLSGLNGADRANAMQSAKMRWDVPDAAPTEKLNRILWRAVKGPGLPYPSIRRSVFTPLTLDVDDDDR